MLEITEVLKSKADLLSIVQEVNQSPFIAQLSTDDVMHYAQDKTVRFLYESTEILGFVAWQNIDAIWTEIGPMYIFPKVRGNCLGTRFAKIFLELNAGKRLFAVTKNPLVKQMLLKAGFYNVTLFALPRPLLAHLLT